MCSDHVMYALVTVKKIGLVILRNKTYTTDKNVPNYL